MIMIRKITAIILAVLLAMVSLAVPAAAEMPAEQPEETYYEVLKVGNPTPMLGRFFTYMWGCTTSDIDVQRLLHGCSPVRYDVGGMCWRFDRSVVRNVTMTTDKEGNKTCQIVFRDDLYYSDETPITAYDYAFTILFTMDPAIRETGGIPMDYSWLYGAEEYLDGTSETLAGVHVVNDYILRITEKKESLPYYYEINRFNINPYPAHIILPGVAIEDKGQGVYLSEGITEEKIRENILDENTGYLSHPSVVSGPYLLKSYDGTTAKFEVNPHNRATDDGRNIDIKEIEYTLAENDSMIGKLETGDFDLLNKVTMKDAVKGGGMLINDRSKEFAADKYERTGLTMIWFMEKSPKLQELAVRQAVAYCFDREGFTLEYAGTDGEVVDGMFGIGQWMYRLASGKTEADLSGYDISMDGLVRYNKDIKLATRLLNRAYWKTDEDGLRYKEDENKERTELKLVLGAPESEELHAALEKYLVANLKKTGIEVIIKPMSMDEIQEAFRSGSVEIDMLYLGDDFNIMLNPEMFKPERETEKKEKPENSLTAARKEVYELAEIMVGTLPDEAYQYCEKWVRMQEEITKDMPLIPVYSNYYHDYFTKRLHGYQIQRSVTWAEAVARCWLDAEDRK